MFSMTPIEKVSFAIVCTTTKKEQLNNQAILILLLPNYKSRYVLLMSHYIVHLWTFCWRLLES